jgi:hypothetical protein
MIVGSKDQLPNFAVRQDLDDLINETVRRARERGYTMQQLTERVLELILEYPPDHILALSPDAGLRRLMEVELETALHFPVRSCSPDDLLVNPALATGALVVSPPSMSLSVLPAVPKIRPPIRLVYNSIEEHLDMVCRLRKPSLIAVVSVSKLFLEIARALLSPVLGRQHSLAEYLVDEGRPPQMGTADVLFCDVIAFDLVRGAAKRKAIPYRLISPECLRQIGVAIGIHAARNGTIGVN